MKNSLFIFLLNLVSFVLNSQTPEVEWENTIGGLNNDELYYIEQTLDGGYIMGGVSQSNASGDKIESTLGGGVDCWIVKVNASGSIEWQNNIGGSHFEKFGEIHQTSDGGYIVAATSASGVSGDKTEAAIGGTGKYDYWVLKLNSTGGIVWQNTIGGTSEDNLKSIQETSDGGYVLGGYSTSGISGDKTEAVVGGGSTYFDYWIVKINATGTIIWQNTIGGNHHDYLNQIIETSDGGFLAAGYSTSGISGDKSENVIGGGTTNPDYWLVKINSLGTIEWEETIGGIYNDYLTQVAEMEGEGFILGGYSTSPVSGDKTEGPVGGGVPGKFDYWVIKLDITSNIIWQSTFGGTNPDYLTTLKITSDGGIIVGGYSYETATGDKNEDYGNFDDDYWIVKLDGLGNILWQDVIGGSNNDYLQCMDITEDGGYILGGYSFSPVSGDKTEGVLGYVCCVDIFYDYWIVKMSPDSCSLSTFYVDYDEDTYGNADLTYLACEASGGYVGISGDCDDINFVIHEGAIEVCDGYDNDCNGLIDDGVDDCLLGPGIEWQNTIGGANEDFLFAADQTTDNGFILGGYSRSDTSSDKSENCIGGVFGGFNKYDYWVVKTDSYTNIIWENTIGGTGDDFLKDIEQTIDGGYILGGYSNSGNTVDKTETFIGSYDYWLVKINAIGSIEWQNVIGGTISDQLQVVHQTVDGGYILGGNSTSGISGDKTENFVGASDFWIVKTNASGVIEWQNTIGGSADDFFVDLKQTPDGGYIIGGQSRSGISGDKLEPYLGLSTEFDYWIVKLNSSGTIEWENTIGGSGQDFFRALELTEDGGYIIVGESSSVISFDKTEEVIGATDIWMLKLDNSGNIVSQNTIGGTLSDYSPSIASTSDGNFLIACISNSNISGDKSINAMNSSDNWVLKVNESGDIVWQNSFGGNENDFPTTIMHTNDGGTFIGGYSKSMISGSKTENNMSDGVSTNDYWIIKVFEECIPSPELCNSLDDNCNGLIDDGITETISITAGGPITFCQGSSVSLTATYSGATVQWKKNGTNIPGATSATYNVTTKGNYSCVTTSACGTAESTPIFVNVIKNPNANISAGGPTTFCAGGSVVLTEVAVAGCTYQWYKGASPIAGATSLTYTATTSGNYKCRVTKAATGCFKNSNAIAVSVPCREGLPAGETGELVENETVIYPNPALNVLTIKTNNNQIKIINLYDALGRLINSQIASENEVFLNVENLPAGTYFIQIVEHQIVSTYNFIKQ